VPFVRGETMAVTEWDLVEYGQRQRDYRRKRHYPIHARRWEGDSLTLDEVIENAKTYYPGLDIKPATVYKWVERGLLPSPTVQSLGGTQGTRAHYPVDAVAQMATAAHMMKPGFKQKEIALARRIVLEGVPVEDEFMRDVVDLLTIGYITSADPNVVRIPSPAALRMAESVRRYALTLATARAGRKVTRPLPACLHKRRWTEDGKPMFSYFASALGYYIDPRGKDDITGLAADLDQQTRQKREEIRRNRNTDV